MNAHSKQCTHTNAEHRNEDSRMKNDEKMKKTKLFHFESANKSEAPEGISNL